MNPAEVYLVLIAESIYPSSQKTMQFSLQVSSVRLIAASFLVALFTLPAIQVYGQMETEQSRKSLRGVKGFYLHVDVEGSLGLTQDEALNVRAIRGRVATELRNAGLNVLEATEVVDQSTSPYLYVHVNMLDMEGGLVPFAINTQFFQQVEIKRQRSSLTACTWDTGLVGLVSYDNLDLIADAAVGSVTNFIDDYHVSNP